MIRSATTGSPETPISREKDNLSAAGDIISSACKWSAAAALIPLPVVDLAALAAVQFKMITDLTELYGQKFETNALKSIISIFLGTLIPANAAGVIASSLKMAPGVGTIIGFATFSTFSASSTYAVGKIIVQHFEGGGSASNFDPETVTNNLKSEFIAANLRK